MKLDQIVNALPTGTALAVIAASATLERSGFPIDPDSWHLGDGSSPSHPLAVALKERTPGQGHNQQVLVGLSLQGKWITAVAEIWFEADGSAAGRKLLRAEAPSPDQLPAAIHRALLDNQ